MKKLSMVVVVVLAMVIAGVLTFTVIPLITSAGEQSAAAADGAWHAYKGWKQTHAPTGVHTCRQLGASVVCTVSDERWSGPRDVRCESHGCYQQCQ